MDAATQYAFAYALTTAAGFRALLTLAVVSVSVHFGFLQAPPGFQWLGGDTVTEVLVALAAIELIADKIPLVDHALHFVQTAAKPAAAAILVGGALHLHSGPELYGLMALGALNALGIHAATASVRGASSVLSFGIANPFISIVEDGFTALLIVLAFFAPIAATALALVVTIVIVLNARRIAGFIRARFGRRKALA